MAKIAIIINSLYTIGGEERVVSLMANEFVKYHEVTIISSETRRKENGKRSQPDILWRIGCDLGKHLRIRNDHLRFFV